MDSRDYLERAVKIIMGPRQRDYGDKKENHEKNTFWMRMFG